MPKKETSKYFYILSIIGALLVIAIAVGSSYAFFTNTKIHSTATVITSGSLTLELNDGNVVGTTKNMIPGDFVTKSFSVTNTSNQALVYDIYLSEIFNDFADKSDLVYSIASSDGGYNSTEDNEVPSETGLQSKIIDSYMINAGATQNYTLTIKFLSKNKNQDNNKGKSFSAKIQINDYKSYTVAMLKDGSSVNSTMGNLSGGTSYINSVRRANSLDENANKEIVSTDDSTNDIYMWFDSNGNILYYYTDASRIYLNEDSSSLFYELDSASSIDMEIFDTSHVENMSYMFYYDDDLLDLDLSNFNTSNVTNMSYMFYFCDSISYLDLSSFNTSNVTDMSYMISLYTATGVNVSSFDTSNVENMAGMFYYCSEFTSLDLSNFDTSKVTDMEVMFEYCNNLESLNLRNFDTSSVEDMSYMFYNCESLTSLDLRSFDTSNVTNMYEMFYECYKLKEVDLSSFDTSNVTDVYGMFRNCNELKTIYVSELWNTSSVSDGGGYMFYVCNALVGEKGTVYDYEYYDITYAHVDEGTSNPGYLTYKASPDAGKSIVITLHPGEGTLSNTTINATIGQVLGELPVPTINNNEKEFRGWYSDSEYTKKVTSSTKVTKRLTNLYAKYGIGLNANGYNYWNDNNSRTEYESTSTPSNVYPNYTYLVTTGTSKSLIRTTYVSGSPTKHEACLYYGETNKIFCFGDDYYESIVGTTESTEENIQAVKAALKNDMETALGVSIDDSNCASSYFMDNRESPVIVCGVGSLLDNKTIRCTAWINQAICFDGSVNCSTSVYQNVSRAACE